VSQSKTTVAKFLSEQIDLCPMSQREVAAAIGFDSPNIITMLKQGHTKVPLNRVGALAAVLGINPAHFMRMVLEEYIPETWDAVERALGCMILSDEEDRLIRVFREMRICDATASTAAV
jgi:transcriptional regulator with XRE-family HTH domain